MTSNSLEPSTSKLSPDEQRYATICNGSTGHALTEPNAESCIVQIYPADITQGMLKLGTASVVLGRDHSVQCVLADSSVSRKHAEISKLRSGYQIKDLGSTNGTLVNGEAIQQKVLKPGDTFHVGSFMFKFLTAGSVESQYHETVYTALTSDALTETMNRRYLIETLKREIARARRKREIITVAMLDIDHFKKVNDTHGHLIGDEVLREIGRRLNDAKREDDMLARFGGEEFCLVLSATTGPQALEMLERCRTSISEQPFITAAGEIPVTASFGFACIQPTESKTINEILAEADGKLYEAKSAGRNCICG